MEANANTQNNPVVDGFINFNKAGDTAIVRLMHSSINTIERNFIHSVEIDGKLKSVKCVGDNCPLCTQAKLWKKNRIYLRLIDYTDNKIKVWIRTDAIISQLSEIEQNWGNLSDCVLKITRIQDEFPKYDIIPMNPMSYPPCDKNDIDQKIAYRFCVTRTAADMQTYVQTGVFPPKQPKPENNNAVPKEQYYSGQQPNVNNPFGNQPSYNPAPNYAPNQFQQNPQVNPVDDPFSVGGQPQSNSSYYESTPNRAYTTTGDDLLEDPFMTTAQSTTPNQGYNPNYNPNPNPGFSPNFNNSGFSPIRKVN